MKSEFDNLTNIESATFKLEELEQLMIVMQENYLEKVDVDYEKLEDAYELARSYPLIQAMTNIMWDILRDTNKEIKEAVYELYEIRKTRKENTLKQEIETIPFHNEKLQKVEAVPVYNSIKMVKGEVVFS
jgi:gas vesicle protein